MKFIPHDYQKRAIQFIRDNPRCALFLDMGLGKTVSTLTALDYKDRVLVIAPLRVAQDTWATEVKKWDHLNHLKVEIAAGVSRDKRIKAIKSDADIVTINVDNVAWLIDYLGKDWPFKTIVIDELSLFKNPASKRFKALRKVVKKADRVIGLTGTPVPKGYEDLFSQVYLLDNGERLGRTISGYRERYFYPETYNPQTGVVYTRKLKPGAKESIDNKLKDIALSMVAEDYLNMPDKIINNITVKLDKKSARMYKELEKEYILEIDEDVITAASAAVVNGKLSQLANGAVYNNEGDVIEIHNAKIDALCDIVEASNHQPVLVFYSYKHDLERIKKRLKKYNTRILRNGKDIQDWNNGKVDVLLCHPASAGHGLNLQAGGHIIVWFSLDWSYELYAQANARLYRQGQKNGVIINHLIVENSVDEDKLKVLKARQEGMDNFLDVFKERCAIIRA